MESNTEQSHDRKDTAHAALSQPHTHSTPPLLNPGQPLTYNFVISSMSHKWTPTAWTL